MALTRRQFIQIGAASAGGAAVASGLGTRWWGLDGDPVPDPRTDGDTVVPTYCELCFWGCGMLAHVQGDRVTKVVGNPQNPLSRGMLCPRGAGATGLLDDPDRLKRPMIRRAKRGEDVFEEVSWDAALGEVSEKLLQVKARHGAEALALFTHGSGGTWFKALMKAWGSPNIGAPSYAQCRGPREAAFQLTFGAPLGSPEPLDLANSRCITLIGSHLGENMHNTQVQELAEALGKGADLVVVDPRFSVAASKARYWLPVKPGTDIALLLAWMHVIIGEGRHDAEWVAANAVGFDELKAHVADTTPAWAAGITGVPAETIAASARLIAAARPASLIHPGRHTVWYGDDTQRERAMAILVAILGSWGRRGGYLKTDRFALAGYPHGGSPPPMRPKVDRPKGGKYPLAGEVLASGLCDATRPGQTLYDLKAWLVYGCNLVQAMPNRPQLLEAIQQLELLVAVDVLPAEICGFADVVLPECTFLERDDDAWNGPWKRPFIAVRQAAVPPRFDSKPGWWIAKALADKLGVGDHLPWKDARDYVQARLAVKGQSWEELSRTGVLLGPSPPTCVEDGAEIEMDTSSKKAELYSRELEELGFEPLPVYRPQEEGPAGHFRLLSGRSPLHTFGRTVNNRLLAQPYPENAVWLNADAARTLSGFEAAPLVDGERVVLINQDGVRSTPVKVKLTQRIHRDCVYLVHGWGQTARKLRYAHGRGASDALLTTRYKIDPIMGGTGMNVNFVRVERAIQEQA